MAKRKVWKGGPRSRRSFVMDYHRQSKETHEVAQQKKKKGSVRPHYRKKKRGGSTKVHGHKRRTRRRRYKRGRR